MTGTLFLSGIYQWWAKVPEGRALVWFISSCWRLLLSCETCCRSKMLILELLLLPTSALLNLYLQLGMLTSNCASTLWIA